MRRCFLADDDTGNAAFKFAVANGEFVGVRYGPGCGGIGPDMHVLEIKEINRRGA